MTVITEDGGRTNLYATEPQMYIDPTTQETNFVDHNTKAEKLNGRFAMMGIIAALGAYAVTGQVIPGIWWLSPYKHNFIYLWKRIAIIDLRFSCNHDTIISHCFHFSCFVHWSSYAHSIWRWMIANWIYLVIFIVIAYIVTTPGDDDDDRDGGMMVPAYQKTQWLVYYSSFLLLSSCQAHYTSPGLLNHQNMAVRSKIGVSGKDLIEPIKKKTRQGNGSHTKLSATSSNKKRKRYRGQGK